MQKVGIMVSRKLKVVRDGVSLLFHNVPNFELVGREGYDVVEEAILLQPDLIIYEPSTAEEVAEMLFKLKNLCAWTKIIIYNTVPIHKDKLKQYLDICDGYLQGPILTGYFLRAIELACFSGYFFYLGSPGDIKTIIKESNECFAVNNC